MIKKVRRSNVKDGVLLPLGNGFSLVKGDHPNKVDDVDIGPNNKNGLSVNHGEILQQKGNTLRVFSAEPMLGGVSPVQLLYGGMAPDKVFAIQEQYKDVHGINDDGSRQNAKYGADNIPMYTDSEGNLIDSIQPSVVTAKLPAKFNGSQAAAARYAEGYKFGKKVAKSRDKTTPFVLNALTMPLDIAGGLELGAAAYSMYPIVKSFVKNPKLYIQNAKKFIGRKYLNMVEDIEKLRKPNSQFRIVDKPAIDDAINNKVIRSKTGLYHGTPEYLEETFPEYMKKIKDWRYKTADEIEDALSQLGAFNNMSPKEEFIAKIPIRNSTNHGNTVGYFKGRTYPNYSVSKTNYVIETPSSAEHFAPGHHGKVFGWPLNDERTGATVLIDKNGIAKNASITTEGSSYWEYSPFWNLWKNKKFLNGGQTNINSLGERPNAKYGKEMKNKRKKLPLIEFVEAFKYLPSKNDLNSAFDATKNLIEDDRFKGGDFGGSGASVGFYGKDGNNPYDYVRNTPILSNRTFSEAYANARKQGLSSFMFNGKKYNTDYDPNAKLGNRIVEQTPVLNLREVLDENEKVITDSTRVEPWVGQLPGMYKRDKYKFGGKRNKALTGITISPYKDRFGNNIDLLKGTVDRDNSNINLLTGEVNHKIANPNNIKLLTGDISKNVVNPVGDLTKSSGLSTTAMSAIGAGINTLGSLIGAGIQQYAINNLKAPQRQYTLLSPVKLKTKININPQIAKMREMQAQIADAARRTSGSSRTAYQKILASHNRLLDSAMDLYGRKENIETELINRDRLNQQQIAQANATNVMNAINYNNEAATEMNNKKQIATSNNWTGTLNTTAGAWAGPNGFIDRANALRVKAGELYTQAIANPTAARLLYGNINFVTDADKRKAFNTIYDFLNNNRFA